MHHALELPSFCNFLSSFLLVVELPFAFYRSNLLDFLFYCFSFLLSSENAWCEFSHFITNLIPASLPPPHHPPPLSISSTMKTPFHTSFLYLLLTLLYLLPPTTAQGTISLALQTSNDETAASASIPFNTLFPASKLQKAVSLHINSASGIPISTSEVKCQCFTDTAGKQALAEPFGTDFPGAELGAEPVAIGAIFCSDETGMKTQMEGVAPAEKVEVPDFVPTTTKTAGAETATATPDAGKEEGPATISLRFALSTDPSDDSSTQMRVPIDSISPFSVSNKKPVFSIVALSMSGGGGEGEKGDVLCQAFADAEAQKPIEAGFGMEEERVLGGGLVPVEAVGCAMLAAGDFGGFRGLVGLGS